MKKITAALLSLMLLLSLGACASPSPEPVGEETSPDIPDVEEIVDFGFDSEISVVSREDGSGTRGAFIELFGVQETDDDGNKTDKTTAEADIADKTAVMMTSVANNPYAIGYISLGSLNDTVKALEIDGAMATVENIKDGSYGIQRPFNIATKGEATGLAKDFIDFILSAEGQEVVAESCIPLDDMPAYNGGGLSGEITIGGSSSITPLMQSLVEAYEAINTGAKIVIDETDSSAGMTDTISGTCDIGMASRALKDAELEELIEIEIATDGIAVIVNRDNPINGLTSEQVKSIYVGELNIWSEIS
ncbi:MAG: substrate-binding domain-containing protein [Oscillospiraceae bacterium]|nr:substrate-binding domain-containing protein [Oscillospiraceae bacterium]